MRLPGLEKGQHNQMSIMSRIREWFSGSPSPVAAVAPRPPFKVPDGALTRSRQKPAKDAANVFAIAQHPPGVGPGKGADMAMDDGFNSAMQWGNAAFSQAGAEGVTFLGYAYLSELAQRPEYRVISETIATEMTRKWIRFTVADGDDDKADQIKEIEAEFKRLNVRDLFARATQLDGFFGRGHIYIDTGDTKDPNELKQSIGDGWDKLSTAKIKKGTIKSLRTVEPAWCYPTSYNSLDPLADNWYRPDSWFVMGKNLHSSRLITFVGREVPDMLKPAYSFGGLSLSQMSKPYVDNFLRNRQSASDILNAFSVFVLSTNMGEQMQADGDAFFKRADLFNNVRDNRGLMMIDKDTEDFHNVSASLAGVTDILNKSQEMMCLPAHTPTVKLWGVQPQGLNADSEGVMRSFYDYIHSYQEHLYRDKIRRVLGLVMLNIWGKTDDSIDFEFEPLWALDEKGLGEVRKLEAETGQILVDTGVISQEEERKRVASDPDTLYQGLDVSDLPDLFSEETEGGLEPIGGKPEVVAAQVENVDKDAEAKQAKAA
jgi:phage-related protein (TIGR01555 family)